MAGADLAKAGRIAERINGLHNIEDASRLVDETLSTEEPDLVTLASACGMIAPRRINVAWHEPVRRALYARFEVALLAEQLRAQRELADSTDRLSRRVLWATWVGIAVAAVGALAAVAALFH